ncbi:MAG: hypothetical protein R3F22_02020 [Lysobacteraceae bacterium]
MGEEPVRAALLQLAADRGCGAYVLVSASWRKSGGMRHRITSRMAISMLALLVVFALAWYFLAPDGDDKASLPANGSGNNAPTTPDADSGRQPRSLVDQTEVATRLQNQRSGPFDDSVWASNVQALAQVAERGDLAVSIRLFKESAECRHYHAALQGAVARLGDSRLLEADWATAADFEQAADELDEMQGILETASALCAGSDADHVDAAFQDYLLLAAQQGHVEAQSCYLVGLHFLGPMDADREQARIDQYLQQAPVFSSNALAHANWSAVRQLAYRLIAAPPEPTTRMDQMPLPDPFLTWRAVRLNYYRARPEEQAYVSDLLDRIANRYGLSELDRQVADQWAQARFDQRYAGQPPLEDMENTPGCPDLGSSSQH